MYWNKFLSSALIAISILCFSIQLNAATLSLSSGEFYKIIETNYGGAADAHSQVEIDSEGALYSWAFSALLGQNGVSAGYLYDLSSFLVSNNLPTGKYNLNIKYRYVYINPTLGTYVNNDFNMIKIFMAINGQVFHQDKLASVNPWNFTTTVFGNELSLYTSGLANAAKNAKDAQELMDICLQWQFWENMNKVVSAVSYLPKGYSAIKQMVEYNQQREINKEITIGAATKLNLFSLVNTVSAGIGGNGAICSLKIDEINLTLIEQTDVVDIKLLDCEQIPWINGESINRATTSEILPAIEIQSALNQTTSVEFKMNLTSLDDSLTIWDSHQIIDTDENGYLQYIPGKIALPKEGRYNFYCYMRENSILVPYGKNIIYDTIDPVITISDMNSGSYHITVSDNVEIARGIISFIDLYETAGQEEKYEFDSAKQWEGDFDIKNYGGIEVTAVDNAGNTSTKVVLKTPKIIVESPLDTEIEKEQIISWDYEGFIGTNVKIEISRNGGTSWETIDDNADNTGTYQWTVTGPTSNNCLIRISSTTKTNISDVSDKVFIITPAPLPCQDHDVVVDHVELSNMSVKPGSSTNIKVYIANKMSSGAETSVNTTVTISGFGSYLCQMTKPMGISSLSAGAQTYIDFTWPSSGACGNPSSDGNFAVTASAISSAGCDKKLSDNQKAISIYYGTPVAHKAYRIKLYEFNASTPDRTIEGIPFHFDVNDGWNQSQSRYKLTINGTSSLYYPEESYLLNSNDIIFWAEEPMHNDWTLRLVVGKSSDSDGFSDYTVSVQQGDTPIFTAPRAYDEDEVYNATGTSTLTLRLDQDPSGSYNANGSNIEVNTSGLSSGTYRFGVLTDSPNTSSYDYLAFGRFEVVPRIYPLTIQKGGDGNGQVKVNGVTCDLPYNGSFNSGTSVTFEAIPGTNSGFVEWTGDAIGAVLSISITINGPKTITANFTPRYTLSLQKAGTGSGSITVKGISYSLPYTQSYDSGTVVQLQAFPDGVSTFTGWSVNLSGLQNPNSITMTNNKTVNVNFSPLNFIADFNFVTVPEGKTSVFNVMLNGQPGSNVVATVSWVSGDTDITVQSGTSLTFTTSNWNTYQTVTLAAAVDADAINSTAVIRVSASGIANKDVTATEAEIASPTITTATPLLAGTVGASYSQTLQASGGSSPYVWSVASGDLPPGLILAASTGVISGTPTTTNTYSFRIRVRGASNLASEKDFSLKINPATNVYVSGSLGNDQTGDGSSGKPWKTIGYAISKASGTATYPVTVHVAAGTYYENISMKSYVDIDGEIAGTTKIVGAASGGVVLFDDCHHARIKGFTISINELGAGMDCGVAFRGSLTDGTAILENSILAETQFGIMIWSPAAPTIQNNTLIGNGDEQGIYIGNEATNPTIRNNIVTGYLWGIHVVSGTTLPTPLISFNDFWNNSTNYINYPDQTGISGNISADPLFVAPDSLSALQGNGDFHLRPGSSCIDAGDQTTTPPALPEVDMDGEARPQGSRYDIGADEFYDSDGDGMPNYWETKYVLNPNVNDKDQDPDGDGYSNIAEFLSGTDPKDKNSKPNIQVMIIESGGETKVEEGGTDTYELVLATKPSADVTVNVSPTDAFTDKGRVTFTPDNWNVPQTVMLRILDDVEEEGPHTATIRHTVTSADSRYNGISAPDVVVSIIDNDKAAVAITESEGNSKVTEGGASDSYQVVLATMPSANVTVSLAVPTGQLQVDKVSLTFTLSSWNVPQTVTVTAVDDSVAEGSHWGTIRHTVTSSDSHYNGLSVADVVVSITDNDTLAFLTSVNSVTVPEGGTAAFQVKLSAQPAANVTVSVARASGDADITVQSGSSLTFTTSNWNTYQTVTLAAAVDADAINSTAVIRVSASGIANKDLTATEAEAVKPTVTIAATDGTATEAGLTTGTFRVSRTGSTTAPLIVYYAVSGNATPGSDYVTLPGSATVAAGSPTAEITVTPIDDNSGESDETVIVTLSTNAGYTVGTPSSATVTIVSEDLVAFVTNVNAITVPEGGTATFQVKLDKQPAANLGASVARASGDADITVQSGSGLTFTPTNWNTYQTVTLAAAVDADAINSTAVIRVSASGIANKDLTATEADKDPLSFVTSVDSVTVPEGGTATFKVKLSAQPAANVTVSVARASGDADITVQSGSSLTFTASNWSTYQTVTLAAAVDADAINSTAVIRVSASGMANKNVAATEAETVKKGDLNGDGATNLSDAILALQVCMGEEPHNIDPKSDVNGDGKIGLAEVLYIMQTIAGLR